MQTDAKNKRIIEPETGRKGEWTSEVEGIVLVRWDDGRVDEVDGSTLLDLNQGALDRFIAGGGIISGYRWDRYLNLKDVDREAAKSEAAAGNPVVTS